MDANGDGVLQPSEVPEERRRMLGFLASRMGADPNGPIDIGRAREAISRRMSSRDDERRDSDRERESRSAKQVEPLVPAFGVEQESPRVPEFGERVETQTAEQSGGSRRDSDRRRGRFSRSSSGDRGGEMEERMRRYAEYTLRRYDTNQSGKLEREEWGQLPIDPSPADRNGDGVLTAEEMGTALAQRMRSRFGGSDSDMSAGNDPGGSGSANGDGRRSYRFRTSVELLPGGLPPWFKDFDRNEDGQVAMAEYRQYWTDADVRRFESYDLNGDGVITPRECLNGGAAGEGETAFDGAPGPPPRGAPPGELPGSAPPPSSTGQSEAKGWWE
jgi:hypothetical protein